MNRPWIIQRTVLCAGFAPLSPLKPERLFGDWVLPLLFSGLRGDARLEGGTCAFLPPRASHVLPSEEWIKGAGRSRIALVLFLPGGRSELPWLRDASYWRNIWQWGDVAGGRVWSLSTDAPACCPSPSPAAAHLCR